MAKPKAQSLNNKQLRCIEYLVKGDKLKQDIAAELGIRRETISAWLKRDDFQAAIKDEMNREFSKMAFKARKKLGELVDSNNPQVALAAAKEVLNKAGYVTTEKVEQSITLQEIEIEIDD